MCDTKSYILNHRKRVQNKLFKLIVALLMRSQEHDKSKLEEPEFSLWEKMDEEPRYQYGSKEYKEKIERYRELFEMHYKKNPHHPEHFMNGISDMTLIDLAEMLCDWISYKDNIRVTEAIEMVEKQSKRFGYSDEIKNMLINTLNTYFQSVTWPFFILGIIVLYTSSYNDAFLIPSFLKNLTIFSSCMKKSLITLHQIHPSFGKKIIGSS